MKTIKKLKVAVCLSILFIFHTSLYGQERITLDEIENVLAPIGSLNDFLENGNAQREYFNLLSRYLRISEDEYQEILSGLDDYYIENPRLAERLWRPTSLSVQRLDEKGIAKRLELSSADSLERLSENWKKDIVKQLEPNIEFKGFFGDENSEAERRSAISKANSRLHEKRERLRQKFEASIAEATSKIEKRKISAEYYTALKNLERDLAAAVIYSSLVQSHGKLRIALATNDLSTVMRVLGEAEREGLGEIAQASVRQQVREKLFELKDPEKEYTRIVNMRYGNEESKQEVGSREIEYDLIPSPRPFHAVFVGAALGECVACDPDRFLYPAVENSQTWFVEGNGRFQGVVSTRPVLTVKSGIEAHYMDIELQGPFLRPVSSEPNLPGNEKPLYESILKVIREYAQSQGFEGLAIGTHTQINNFSILESLYTTPSILLGEIRPFERLGKEQPEMTNRNSGAYTSADIIDDFGLNLGRAGTSWLVIISEKNIFREKVAELKETGDVKNFVDYLLPPLSDFLKDWEREPSNEIPLMHVDDVTRWHILKKRLQHASQFLQQDFPELAQIYLEEIFMELVRRLENINFRERSEIFYLEGVPPSVPAAFERSIFDQVLGSFDNDHLHHFMQDGGLHFYSQDETLDDLLPLTEYERSSIETDLYRKYEHELELEALKELKSDEAIDVQYDEERLQPLVEELKLAIFREIIRFKEGEYYKEGKYFKPVFDSRTVTALKALLEACKGSQ